MKITATQQAQTQQAETPLHIMPILEARQKEIALADSTGAVRKAIETGVTGLRIASRFALSAAGSLGRAVFLSDANSPVLGHQASSRRVFSEADEKPWQSDWQLYSHARR